METKPITPRRSYEDFEPPFEWNREEDEGSETLVISLPGFSREQLKVQMDNFGNLTFSGERPLAGDRWRRFRKEFRIPENTSTADIRAKLESGNLHVIFPKLFARPHQQPAQPSKVEELKSSEKTAPEPEPETETKPEASGAEMRFKKPRQLMLNVGVAVVILVVLAFYVSYKLRKSIDSD